MAGEISDGACLHVGARAALERNAMVVDVVEQVAVFAQAAPVTDAVSPADVNGLSDRFGAVRLAGVNRHVDVVVANELKRRLVMLGGMVVFGAGEIEADYAAILVGYT